MKLCVTFITKLFNWFKRRRLLKDGEISKLKQQESTKCSQCGNVVELLLPCTGFDDPVVYKCAHCQCTITYPGTSVITESGNIIPSWSRREKIIDFRDGEIKFVGKIHNSVGWEYKILYPQDSFRVYKNIVYCHSGINNMQGGDEATVEYTLKPIKTGLFCITEKTYFRGNLDECDIHYFLVE